MKLRTIFVFTHDSIGLGEDGPTHQAVEHAASLRLIPNMTVWRPCDTVETAVAWAAALEHANGPTCLLFTRQNVPLPEARRARRSRRSAAAATCSPTGTATGKRARDHRHGLRSRAGDGRARCARGRRHRRARRVDAVHARLRPARTPRTATSVLPRGRSARRRRSGRRPTAGASTWAPSTIRAEPSSASTRYGESAPGGGAVQILRLHRGERGRARSKRVARMTCRSRHPPRHGRRRTGDRARARRQLAHDLSGHDSGRLSRRR